MRRRPVAWGLAILVGCLLALMACSQLPLGPGDQPIYPAPILSEGVVLLDRVLSFTLISLLVGATLGAAVSRHFARQSSTELMQTRDELKAEVDRIRRIANLATRMMETTEWVRVVRDAQGDSVALEFESSASLGIEIRLISPGQSPPRSELTRESPTAPDSMN
jgi:hypothetical protein